jgi:hypothetical protein
MQIKVADSQRQDLDAVVAAPIVQDVLQNVGIPAFRRARKKAAGAGHVTQVRIFGRVRSSRCGSKKGRVERRARFTFGKGLFPRQLSRASVFCFG